MITMKKYVGVGLKPQVFESEKEPTKETHPQYNVIFGPFKSKEDAQRYVNAMDQGVACGEG